MMNQHLASIFSIVKEEKVFQFMCGSATFDEVQEVLDQFKADFAELKVQREEEEAKKKAEAESAEVVLDPEIVGE